MKAVLFAYIAKYKVKNNEIEYVTDDTIFCFEKIFSIIFRNPIMKENLKRTNFDQCSQVFFVTYPRINNKEPKEKRSENFRALKTRTGM